MIEQKPLIATEYVCTRKMMTGLDANTGEQVRKMSRHSWVVGYVSLGHQHHLTTEVRVRGELVSCEL